MGHAFDRIEAAAVDGRAHNVFYRQQQIESLCRTLLENAEKIRQAIISDSSSSLSEVTVEFNLALTAIQANYASLQPKKAHEEEYAVANGKDAPESRAPVGIVYIEPATHTVFYSTVVPLSAALAAGNCVIVVLENNLRATSNLLRRLLSSSLSSDTFGIASSRITDEELLSKAIGVKQNGSNVRWPQTNELISLPQSRAIAVVDRTANVQLAAKELVTARFSFNGTSPYAPDIVLVNEFAKKEFLQAVVSECVKRGTNVEMNGTLGQPSIDGRVSKKIEALKRYGISDARIVVQESKFAVVDLPTRLNQIPEDKIIEPVLVVCSMRSLDDAIDLAGRSSSDPYIAAYHFSDLRAAKYLSQFVDARVTTVNHVPRELLIGPTFPIERSMNLMERYPISLFENQRPVIVNSSAQSKLLSTAVESPSNPTVQQLWKSAVAPLAAMKRVNGGGVGFFEQGFLMSAALILTSTIAISGTGAWYLWRYSKQR